MRLYIADDNIEFASFCAKVASSEGWKVTLCQNGAELLEELRHETGVAMILCDINMPVIDGIEVIVQLRDIERPLMVRLMTGGLPVNAIAAQLIGEAQGLIDGRFLYKPVSIVDLRAALASGNASIIDKYGSWNP